MYWDGPCQHFHTVCFLAELYPAEAVPAFLLVPLSAKATLAKEKGRPEHVATIAADPSQPAVPPTPTVPDTTQRGFFLHFRPLFAPRVLCCICKIGDSLRCIAN